MKPVEQFQSLPKIKEVSNFQPVLVTDTREQKPLAFKHLLSVRETLQTGDYSIPGAEHLFTIERKSIDDLVGCCIGANRERFERELCRIRGFDFKRLLIVGTEEEIMAGQYYSKIKPASVIGTIRAFEVRYDIPVVYSGSCSDHAALMVERWAWAFTNELTKRAKEVLKERAA